MYYCVLLVVVLRLRLQAALLGLLVLAMVATAFVAFAQTSYSPRWTARASVYVNQVKYTVDNLWGIGDLGGYIYVSGNYLNSTNNHYGIAVIKYDESDGGFVSARVVYSSSSDAWSNALTVNNNYVYVVGYVGSSAWIGALDTGLSSLAYSNSYSQTNHDASYKGVCLDGDGNVYAVGVDWDLTGSKPVSYMLLSSFTSTLGKKFDATYSGSYNLSGEDCVVGPDGYLYVVALDRWYSSSNDYYYPVYLYVLKLSPVDGSIVGQISVQLYNDAGYLAGGTDVPAGIGSDGTYLYVAFTYSDNNPSGSTSAGASVMGLDTGLNILWRYNVSTDYQERFYSIAVGSDGSFAVGGSTNNPYGTGLSSSYFNAFLLVFDSNHNLVKALLSGDSQGSYGTSVHRVVNDGDGYVYWAGYAGDDDQYTVYYDVTSEVSVSKSTSSVQPGLYGTSVKLPEGVLAKSSSVKVENISRGVNNVLPVKSSGVGVTRVKIIPGILSTPSGDSNGILVATNEQVGSPVQPPAPVPENGLLFSLGVLAGFVFVVVLRPGRRG